MIDRLWKHAEAELGMVDFTQDDVPDFGFHYPVDAVFAVWYGMKDQHLPEPGGLLDQPDALINDVQTLNYLYTIVRHIVREENKGNQSSGGDGNWSDTVRNQKGEIVGTFIGNMFDGT